MVGMMNGGRRGRPTLEMLERTERRLAWDQIKRTLARLPDREIARMAATKDAEALAAAGITRELISLAVGDPDDSKERARRMKELFDLPEERKRRIREYLEVIE